MHVKNLSTAVMAIAIGTCTFAVQADGNNWSPNQPTNTYWQTPNWGGFNMPGSNSGPRPYNYNRPPPGYYGAPNNQRPNYSGQNNPPPPNMNRPPMQNMAPPPNMNRPPNQNMASPSNANRGYPPPPQGPYNSRPSYNDNGASAYNMPGYNRNRNRNNNSWNNNKFWGRSGPSRWMNPNKRNMEDGWDDMINAPSRMGDDMPGGWSAPEVTMPNPVDMGDQMQDNMQDLPDQMRDGNIGNNIND